jgi:hypothetical protein
MTVLRAFYCPPVAVYSWQFFAHRRGEAAMWRDRAAGLIIMVGRAFWNGKKVEGDGVRANP